MKVSFFIIACLLLFSSFNSKLPIKYIYLTFDDGPLKGSENIDSVILAERLKISVFLVGEHVEESRKFKGYYNMYEQNPFIESYNHSFTHAHNKYKEFYSNPQNVLADIEKNEQALNLHFKIVRLPGRNIWRIGTRIKDDGADSKVVADLLATNGFTMIGWDIEWQHKDKDATPIQTVDQMTKTIESRLANSDHLVVLLHDEMFQKKWEESELHQLIDNLRKHENYVFEHVRFYPRK